MGTTFPYISISFVRPLIFTDVIYGLVLFIEIKFYLHKINHKCGYSSKFGRGIHSKFTTTLFVLLLALYYTHYKRTQIQESDNCNLKYVPDTRYTAFLMKVFFLFEEVGRFLPHPPQLQTRL